MKFIFLDAFVEGGYFHTQQVKQYGRQISYGHYRGARGDNFCYIDNGNSLMHYLTVLSMMGLVVECLYLLFKGARVRGSLRKLELEREAEKMVKKIRKVENSCDTYSEDSESNPEIE
ncbi:hypothetical protein RF11_02159 [Thelohanellus kitauei]|uniref:Uncharacterized protein n=1 Tax=Thelohanellus kitauei TaxID=669202 RepID=A0A0C2N520_THEKT|nr:hypothetical protein RF11_02159 [Thelohanellus kitauei]